MAPGTAGARTGSSAGGTAASRVGGDGSHGPGAGLRLAPIPVTTVGDASTHEVAVMAPLVALTVVLGLLPWLLLDVTGPAVRVLLAGTGTVGP